VESVPTATVLPQAPSPLLQYYRECCSHPRNYRGVRDND